MYSFPNSIFKLKRIYFYLLKNTCCFYKLRIQYWNRLIYSLFNQVSFLISLATDFQEIQWCIQNSMYCIRYWCLYQSLYQSVHQEDLRYQAKSLLCFEDRLHDDSSIFTVSLLDHLGLHRWCSFWSGWLLSFDLFQHDRLFPQSISNFSDLLHQVSSPECGV